MQFSTFFQLIMVLLISIFAIQPSMAKSSIGPFFDEVIIADTESSIDSTIFKDQSIYEPKSGLGTLFKFLPEILGGLFRFIGDLVVGIFEILSAVIRFIWDGLAWLVHSIGDIASSVYSRLAGNDVLSAIINGSDDAYKLQRLAPNEVSGVIRQKFEEFSNPTLDIFLSIPSDSGDYSRIFVGESASSAELAAIGNSRKRFSKIANEMSVSVKNATEGDDAREFAKVLDSSKSDYVAVVGHNDEAGFRFPNGDAIPLKKLGAMCIEAAKSCIFLSCNSAKSLQKTKGIIGVDYKLTYKNASDIIENLGKYMGDLQRISPEEAYINIESQIATLSLKEHIKPKIRLLLVSTATGTSLAGIIVEFDEK